MLTNQHRLFKWVAVTLLTGLTLFATAQKKWATVSGKVVDENDQPLAGVSILLLGRASGNISSDSGTFRITVPANKAFALTFSHLGYRSTQRNFLLNENEKEILTVKMEKGSNELNTVVVTDQRQAARPRAGIRQGVLADLQDRKSTRLNSSHT